MCERISGICIEGGYFNELCTITPFALTSPQGKPRYVSIIYGKNGSGKTSLAQGFYEIATGDRIFNKSEFIGHDGLPINDIDRSRIFVFDENYIRRTIGFTEDGLDSVVMLGEQVELDEQIKTQESQLSILNKEIDADKISFNSSYETDTSILAPEHHWKSILDNLRKNWSVRESTIRGLRQNAPVRDEFISSLFINNEYSTLEEVRAKFEEVLIKFKTAQSGECVNETLVKIGEDVEIDSKIVTLLGEKISEPVLSDREQLIMQMIKDDSGNESFLMRAKSIFSDPDIKICPFCLQNIDTGYRNDLVSSISKVFDTDEAARHREELSSIQFTSVEIDLRLFRLIDNSLCEKIQEMVNKYNKRIILAQEKVTKKLSSIYTPLACSPFGIHELQKHINQSIDLLSQAQATYNKNISSIAELKSELALLNKSYAREEVRQTYEQYQRQLTEKESKKTSLLAKVNESKRIKESIAALNAQKKNIHVAIEIINNYLAYIFFEKSRLQLEISDGKYIVKCRGQHVRLPSLSMGERNVIALCYFLSILFHDKQKLDIYKEKCLIVLDDPISSFDFDNKIGMYSFLRYIFNSIYESNKLSRCLILTHELEATFSLIRICADISLNSKAYELKDKTLIPFSEKKYNEYSLMLYKAFSYAKQENNYTEHNESIGNIMRRILEAYGTFTYQKGIEALSCDQDVLATIKDEKKRAYFNNLMYRLVLNGESHLQERAQGIPDTDFFSYIGEAEKIRTAREILIFLYLLNPLHLREHFKVSSPCAVADILRQIQAWDDEIFSQ